jgi:uncharacterized protein (UPF0264 family)
VTRLLVSVVDSVEAAVAASQGADLIDAKDPSQGALGALPASTVRAIKLSVPEDVTTSAVAGDDEDVDRLAASALEIARTGMTFVKLGLTRATATQDVIETLGRRLEGQGRFIAVLFADEGPQISLLPILTRAGFAGAMLDTRNKISGRLRDVLALDQLAGFTSECRQQGLMCGLAGSLRIEDIPILARLLPDYLGFRGGLCRAGDRTGRLDPKAIQRAAGAVAAANAGDRAE